MPAITPPTKTGETWAGKIRRILTGAVGNNPLERDPLRGGKGYPSAIISYSNNLAVTCGQFMWNGGCVWLALNSATTAASGPGPQNSAVGYPTTYTTEQIQDGGVQFQRYLGTAGRDFVSNAGNLYALIAASGSTPAGTAPTGAAPAADGGFTWAYVGPQEAPIISLSGTHNSALTKTCYANGTNPSTGAANNPNIDGLWPFKCRSGVAGTHTLTGFVKAYGDNVAPATGADSTPYWVAKSTIWETDFFGATIEYLTYSGAGSPKEIIVDGRFVDFVIGDDYSGGNRYLTVDFSGMYADAGSYYSKQFKTRRLGFGIGGGVPFSGAAFLFPAIITYPDDAQSSLNMMAVGDSQIIGSGTNDSSMQDLPTYMMHYFGATRNQNRGTGGVGWADGYPLGPASYPYPVNLYSDIAYFNSFKLIDMFVYFMSQDDAGLSGGNTPGNSAIITAAILGALQTTRALYPAIPIFLFGLVMPTGQVAGAQSSCIGYWVEQAGVNAFNQYQAINPDPMVVLIPWLTETNPKYPPDCFGTGNEGAPANNGSADLFCSAGGVHRSWLGSKNYARIGRSKVLDSVANIP